MHFIGRNPSDKSVVVCLPAELDGELLVTDDERAILFESGAVLADLDPGRHRLNPARIPALRVAGDLGGVQIYLVRTAPVLLPVRGTTQPVPVDGYNVLARVELDGRCQLQVTDPRLLLTSLAATGSEIAAALDEATGQAIRIALAQALVRSGGPLPEFCAAPPPALLEEVRAQAAGALAPHGASVTSLELALRLDDETQLQLARTMPPTASSPEYAATEPAPSPVPPPAHSGCSICGAPLAPGARFCSGCGKPVTVGPPRCGACGATLAQGARFCSGCGAKC